VSRETIEITLPCRASLLYWPVGQRVTWQIRNAWYRRVWRWLMRRNWRVARIDFERELLVVERCR
jgi:hypothetical protein